MRLTRFWERAKGKEKPTVPHCRYCWKPWNGRFDVCPACKEVVCDNFTDDAIIYSPDEFGRLIGERTHS